MSLETLSIGKNQLNQFIHYSYPTEIEIYGQAVLRRSSALSALRRSEFNPSTGVNIIFSLGGELSGNIICQMDIEKKSFSFEKQALITEAMNILIGQMLTNFEKETGLLITIGNPSIINEDHAFFTSLINHPHNINLKTNYSLFSLENKIDCSLFLFAQRITPREI